MELPLCHICDECGKRFFALKPWRVLARMPGKDGKFDTSKPPESVSVYCVPCALKKCYQFGYVARKLEEES